jgi:ribosomal protein S18 acetylase RimI-like enzyme
MLIAKNKGRLVGFAYASFVRDFPFEVSDCVVVINDVYVSPEFHGLGIGKRLIVDYMDKLKSQGAEAVRLTVLTDNKAAVELCERLGFKTCRYGMLKTLRH